jgi:hypothetical protein
MDKNSCETINLHDVVVCRQIKELVAPMGYVLLILQELEVACIKGFGFYIEFGFFLM